MTDYEIYQGSFVYTLYRVTPSLRYIFLEIDRPRRKVILKSYYEKEPSEIEKELIDDIGGDIIGMLDEPFDYEININITTAHIDSLEKKRFLLFARFEGLGYEDELTI